MTFDFHDLATAGSTALIASLWILPLAALLAFSVTAVFHKASKNALYIACASILLVSVLLVFCVFCDELHKPVFDLHQAIGSSLEPGTARFSEESIALWNFNPILVIGLWGAGAAIGIVRFARDLLFLREYHNSAYHVSPKEEMLLDELRRGQALSKDVKILKSNYATSPFACFALNPVIFVPANFFDVLEGEQCKSILKHEMVHIARGDLVILYVERFLACLFYFTPAFFYLRSLIHSFREASADDLSAKTESDCKSLALALARLAEASVLQTQRPLTLSSGYYNVSDRVASLLKVDVSKADRQRKRIRHLILFGLLTSFGGLGYAVAHTGAPIEAGSVSSLKSAKASAESTVERLLDEADLLFSQAEAAYSSGSSATGERLHAEAERIEIQARGLSNELERLKIQADQLSAQ